MRTSSLLLFRELRGEGREPALHLLTGGSSRDGARTWHEGDRVFSIEDPSDEPGSLPAAVAVTAMLAPGVVELGALVVHPECRGRGVGWHLVTALADRCRADGIRSIVARVDHPAVRALLSRSGFRPLYALLDGPGGSVVVEPGSGVLILDL